MLGSISKPESALVLLGHGSTLNPDSSGPTWRHADELRRRGIFGEIVCAFWKEEPGFREVFNMLDAGEVYVVPNFISEGYFTQEVLPRELRLTGRISRWQGKRIYYCDPVGLHPSMTKLLLKRAAEVAPGIPRSSISLVIVGHGTSLNENSAAAVKAQAGRIRALGVGFAEVVEAFMEEAPLVSQWRELTSAPNVVVVPFFVADGLHSYEDIPVMLGIREKSGGALSDDAGDVFRHNPYLIDGRRLYYSAAIGTERSMADVILDQVAAFDNKFLTPADARSADI